MILKHTSLKILGFSALVLCACWFAQSIPTAAAITCPGNTQECNGACIGQGIPCCASNEVLCNNQCEPEGILCLLEPPPGTPPVIQPGQNAWQLYVNQGLWQWALMIGVALAVLNGTIAGFQIMIGDRDKGKERFTWSLVGLVLLLFAGVILAFINPNAFTP